MGKFLTAEQRAELKFVHGMEDKRRYADRIKALLLLDSGWKLAKISEALLLDEKTIRIYRKYYEEGGVDRLCCDELQGSSCQLSPDELKCLAGDLRQTLYSSATEIVAYVKEKFGVDYSLSGMTRLLHRLGFVYKKTRIVTGKADSEKQQEFLKELAELKSSMSSKDKLYYMDGVHPQHNSHAAYAWIPRGEEKKLKTNTGRKRLNLNGALDAETKEVVIREDQTLNAESTKALLQTLEAQNPDAGKIYVIVDNARYYRNKKIKEYLQNSRIILMFLPAYAPNLNLIERLWKFFKKKVLANTYYESFALFRKSCLCFFAQENLSRFRSELESLLSNKFQIISA